MLRWVNPTMLFGLVTSLVLLFAISAYAQLAEEPSVPLGDPAVASGGEPLPPAAPVVGGTAGDALGVGEAQLGKPFAWGTDGPDVFSCSGLMRYVLRVTGVDPDAPWTPEEYLGRYPAADAAEPLPGDIIIYPDWATMYAGDGMLLTANQLEGVVTHTPMEYAGEPLGAVRPY